MLSFRSTTVVLLWCGVLFALHAAATEAGITITPPTPLNTNAATDNGDDAGPSVATDGNGTWLAVWSSASGTINETDSEILFARSVDNGITWSDPQILNNNAATESTDDLGPSVATDKQGTWVVVWQIQRYIPGPYGSDMDILFARSTDNGQTWTDPQPLNCDAPSDTGHDAYPQIATDGRGTWMTVWWPGYSARSIDGGATWTCPPVFIGKEAGLTRIATDGHGTWVTTFSPAGGTTGPDQDILVACSTDDGVTWTAPVPLNTTATSDTANDGLQSLTTDGQGNWIAVWTLDVSGEREVLVARSVNPCATWTDPAILDCEGVTDSGIDEYPDITTDENGNWIAVWRSNDHLDPPTGSDFDIMIARSTDNGLNWTCPPQLLNTDAASDTRTDWTDIVKSVGTDGHGNWVVVWAGYDIPGSLTGTDFDIFTARFALPDCNRNIIPDQCDLTCGPAGGPCDVPGCGLSADCNANGIPDECDPSECVPGDPPPCRLTTCASPLDPVGCSDTVGNSYPQLETDGNGTWVAIWMYRDYHHPTEYDIDIRIARSFDEGRTWTTPIPLNTNAAVDQVGAHDGGAQIATDRMGTWVVVWESSDIVEGREDILSACSTDNGATWTDPLAIVGLDGGWSDSNASLSTDGAGHWGVVWQRDESGAGSPDDIFVSRSTDPCNAWTARERIASLTGDDGTAAIALDPTGVWIVMWRTEGFGGDWDIAFARSSDFGQTWTQPCPLNPGAATDSASETEPYVATDRNGRWISGWYSNEGGQGFQLAISRSSDPLCGNWTVPAYPFPNQGNTGGPNPPEIVPQGGGTWMLAWDSTQLGPGEFGEWNPRVSFSVDNGATWTPSCVIDYGSFDAGPSVATAGDGRWMVAWDQRGGVCGADDDIFSTVISFPDAGDCNGNLVNDECDIASGTSADCNANGIPDECDIADCTGDPACADCNNNGVPDECDIANCPPNDPSCQDCNGDGRPDECGVIINCNAHQVQKLIASDAGTDDAFGTSVSISGDTMVVGAYQDDCAAGTLCGSAYVYKFNGADWIQQGKFTASDADGIDVFGISVSVSGDTIVVGAYAHDCGAGVSCGAAYVFVKPEGGWSDMTQTAKLTASDAAAHDAFGYSVSMSRDTIVVGAFGDDCGGGDECGAVYVYVKPGGGWSDATQTAKLTVSDAVPFDQFAVSVAIDGDTIVAGAQSDDVSGSAYVFIKPGGGWTDMTETAKLSALGVAPGDSIGRSVAISGDTIVVGAYHNDCEAGPNCGSAYVFRKLGGAWSDMTQTTKLTASDAAADDIFAESVSINGDTIVVGAFGDDCGNGDACGAAYLFVEPVGGWQPTMTETAKLTASDAAPDDWFGVFVSLSANTIVVAARRDDCGAGIDCGSAYVFSVGGPDCNCNGIADACDIADCPGDPACGDCNANGIPDECDIRDCPTEDLSCQDCNHNGIPDGCEGGPLGMCPNDCSGHGFCDCDTCLCDAGWTGVDCSIALCDPMCVNGMCTAPNVCTCDPGWTGPDCSTPICNPPCVNGTCTTPNTCTCDPGWTSPQCQNPDCNRNGIPDSNEPTTTVAFRVQCPNPPGPCADGVPWSFLIDWAGPDISGDCGPVPTLENPDGRNPPDLAREFARCITAAIEAAGLDACQIAINQPGNGAVFRVTVPGSGPLQICVGPAGGPPNCCVADNNDRCPFNPELVLFVLPTIPPVPEVQAHNRALGMRIEPPVTSTGMETAIQVTMIDLQNPVPPNLPQFPPPDFSNFESGITCTDPSGCVRWVGKPGTFLESQDSPGLGSFRAARLQCTPYYRDWSTLGEEFLASTDPADDLFHIAGAEVIPSSTYDLRMFPVECMGDESNCFAVSVPVTMLTRRSGDVAANFNPPSTTDQPDAIDIAQVVNKLKSVPGSLVKSITQLQPNLVELNADINALDIAAVVDAVKFGKYAFSGPCPCPSTVTCGLTGCTSDSTCAGIYGAESTCVKTCTGGTNAGDSCINDSHCPGSTCGAGFCRDRCGRCN